MSRRTEGSGGGWFEEPWTGSCPCAWLPALSSAHCRAPFVGKLRLPLPTAPAGLCQDRTVALMSQWKENPCQASVPRPRATPARISPAPPQSPAGYSAAGDGQRATYRQPMSPVSGANTHRALGMLPHPAPVSNSSPGMAGVCCPILPYTVWGSQVWGTCPVRRLVEAGIHPSWPGQCVPALQEWWVQVRLGRGTEGLLCKSGQDGVGKAPGVS